MNQSADDVSFFLPNDLSRCHNCGGGERGTKLKRCGGCSLVMYCSKECQRTAWPTHKLGCRSKGNGDGAKESPSAAEARRAKILQAMGFPTAVSFAHALKDWAEAHRWSFTTMTKTVVLLEGGPDILQLDSSTPYFMSYVVGPNKLSNGSPASRFRVESVGVIPAEEYRHGGNSTLMKAWEDAEPGRKAMDASFREDKNPAFAGVISVIYFLKDTGMVVHNQHPVYRTRRQGPLDEPTKIMLMDLLSICKGSINTGVSLRINESSRRPSHSPIPGYMVRSKKTWTWQPMLANANAWNLTATVLPSYVAKSGMLPKDIFDTFAKL